MEAVYDGYILKYANRKASEPMARLLAKIKITPNQITWAAFGIALLTNLKVFYRLIHIHRYLRQEGK